MKAGKTTDQIFEALGILQEECAEAIVEVSKVRRFGFDNLHYKSGISHKAHLEQEVGDILAMVDILVEQGVLDVQALDSAKFRKKEKLKDWSKIFQI